MTTKPLCRCCQNPLDMQEQPALVPGREPSQLVTCRNVFCQLFDYTFTLENYADVDLSKYCADAPIVDAIAQAEQLAASRRQRIAEHTRIFRRADFGTQGTEQI